MSRPKHDWYYHAVRQIRKYPDELAREGTLQANVWKGAVERTLEHTRKMPDGDLRVKAVELRFFDRRYTIEGIAQQIYVSDRTVRRWTQTFVNMTGKEAGY